ncbi:MAG: radical SAM protein [Flavobacteriales bacterium]|nr:radical SAM protein [Flavobacteriales bacterium]
MGLSLIKSLKSRNSELSDSQNQLNYLNDSLVELELPSFEHSLLKSGHPRLKPSQLEIFQINLGYMCNQTCKHCHVDAGPDRKEIMSKEHLEKCLEIVSKHKIPTIDLTGGAPEMNPHFRWFVEEATKAGVSEIIVRSNLTIILANPKYHDLPEFFAKHNLRVISSLPFYQASKTDSQRGEGVFNKSIQALKMLNEVGYGKEDSDLFLDLVYNPAGAFLPADQSQLEKEFKNNLERDHNIHFNSLFTITNLPISRYLEYLIASDNYEDYMEKLIDAYNPAAVEGLMCRNTISVDWQGYLYDCDFNQMLEMKVEQSAGQHLDDFDIDKLAQRDIQLNQHCYGCTAGAGSSCQGAVA